MTLIIMKKVIAVLITLLAWTAESLALFTAYNSPLLKYTGHWDLSGTKGPAAISYYDGANIQFSFTGSSLTLVLGNTQADLVSVLVDIDGNANIYKQVYGNVLVTPATLISNSTHNVTVAPIFYTDNLLFAGAHTDGPVSRILPTKYVFEFIGDSITAGYQTSLEALNSYSWLMPQLLGNYDRAIVGFPGICLDNITCFGNTYGMSAQYFIIPTEYGAPTPPTPFNFNTTYQPTDIFINIGTNDVQYGINNTDFASLYTAFVKKVRSVRPQSRIHIMKLFGLYSIPNPATKSPPLPLYDPTIQQIANDLQSSDSNIFYVDTTGYIEYPIVEVQSDGIHPTEAGHFNIARKLAAYWTSKNFR